MMMQDWISFDTDWGGALWGILCCWLVVFLNPFLFSAGFTVFYVVPFDLFGIPAIVTFGFWLLQRALRRRSKA